MPRAYPTELRNRVLPLTDDGERPDATREEPSAPAAAELIDAVGPAFATVTAGDGIGYFNHCGYTLHLRRKRSEHPWESSWRVRGRGRVVPSAGRRNGPREPATNVAWPA